MSSSPASTYEFRALDMARVRTLLKRPLMVDRRNIYTPREMAEAGFEYHSVGRTVVKPALSVRSR